MIIDRKHVDPTWRFITHNGVPIKEYDAYGFFEGLRYYWGKSASINLDYYVERNGRRYREDEDQGHRCFFYRFENEKRDGFNKCFYHSYGRLTFGCKRIPVFDTYLSWRREHVLQFIIERGEVFWFQCGVAIKGKWYIDKEILKDIARETSGDCRSCPIFYESEVLDIIDELPQVTQIENNPFFEFVRINQIADRPLLQYFEDRKISPTYMVLRRFKNRYRMCDIGL